jgi:hypothetical protein
MNQLLLKMQLQTDCSCNTNCDKGHKRMCKVKLLNGTKYKIISTGLKAYGGVEVWLLSLNYKISCR